MDLKNINVEVSKSVLFICFLSMWSSGVTKNKLSQDLLRTLRTKRNKMPNSNLKCDWVKGKTLTQAGYLVSASVFWILKFISCWSICLLRFSHSSRAFCRSLTTSPYPNKIILVTSEHSPFLGLKLSFQLFKLNT